MAGYICKHVSGIYTAPFASDRSKRLGVSLQPNILTIHSLLQLPTTLQSPISATVVLWLPTVAPSDVPSSLSTSKCSGSPGTVERGPFSAEEPQPFPSHARESV